MKRNYRLFEGAVLGGITAAGVAALFYLLMNAALLPFFPFDIFDWMTRHLPGAVIAFGISTMVNVINGLHLGATASTAKLAEQSVAILQFLAAGIVFGLLLAYLGARFPRRITLLGLIGGGLLFLFAMLVEIELGFPQAGALASTVELAVLLLGWGWALSRALVQPAGGADTPPDEAAASRRKFLGWLVSGSIGFGLLALGISYSNRKKAAEVASAASPNPTPAQVSGTNGPASSPPVSVLDQRFPPVPGTRPELTPTDQFYRIDINTDVPTTDLTQWRLKLGGLVNQPLSLSLDEIRQFPTITQALTLSCISNDVGGDLIGTTVWTGVPFKTVLEKAGLKPDAKFFNIQSFDGYYECVGIDEAMDERTLLVYQMEGAALPPEHGFPLRIYIPDHYGMKQPKWIAQITAVDQQGPGYWVDRGWDWAAIPQTTSVIDTVVVNSNDPKTGTVSVGGIAWAGDRGISKVEVQMDSGPWTAARLREPPLSELTWILWRIEFPYQSGRHAFRVRATDGQGVPQIAVERPPEPSGATGIDVYSANL